VIGFTKTVSFLADVHAFEFMVVQQMIAAVLEPVNSIEFNIAEWTHPGFIRTDSYQLFEVEQGACHAKPSLRLNENPTPFSCCSRRGDL
jgi:hypothetical protein